MRALLCFTIFAFVIADFNVVDIMKSSKAYQAAAASYKKKRADAGLPDLVPHTQYVRMRDGTLLWTLYWDPRIDKTKAAPAVLIRSPYGVLGTEQMTDLFLAFGFVAVQQNQRGTGESGGDYCFWMTTRYDGYDTMEWIKAQEWSNGQVFQAGASADGILTLLDMKIPQPSLGGQWLMITTSTPYDTLFQNGQALRQGLAKNWLALMQLSRPKVPANTYYETAMRNEGFGSHYTPPGFQCGAAFDWRNITIFKQDIENNVNFPTAHMAGWYDIFLGPQLHAFRSFGRYGGPKTKVGQKIVIDPRGHCFFETSVSFPEDRLGWLWSFEQAVDAFKSNVDEATRRTMPPSPAEMSEGFSSRLLNWTMYVMGPHASFGARHDIDGMYWTTVPEWPASVPNKLYLGPNRALTPVPLQQGSVSFVYNPNNPTPTTGGNNLFLRCGPQNQTSNDVRSDNVYFQSAPFSQSSAILGSIFVSLRVSTSANDTDFVVRVSDVYPDGYTSILLSDNVVRMRWRNSDSVESKTVPGSQYVITMEMWELCYVFNKGHSIRIAVTSSNYPRYSLNLNNGLLAWEGGTAVQAKNSIFFGADTFVTFPTVPLSTLPKLSVL